MTKLDEALEAIRHRDLVLQDGEDNPHRPELSVWAGTGGDEGEAVVVMTVRAMHGQQQRFVEFVPDKARALAQELIAMAETVERVVDSCAEAAGKIVTSFIHPPIPVRTFDWIAYRDGDEEGGARGYGCTEAEAITDLVTNFPDDGAEAR